AWGIVQNLSGEDWKGVELSLVAGAPLAFQATLEKPVVPPRPVVSDQGEVIASVPVGETSLAEPPPPPPPPPPAAAPPALRAGEHRLDSLLQATAKAEAKADKDSSKDKKKEAYKAGNLTRGPIGGAPGRAGGASPKRAPGKKPADDGYGYELGDVP